MEKFLFDVAVGLTTAIVTMVAKWQWPLIKSVFDEESRRQAAQINGQWDATELFTGSNETNNYLMHITCVGGRVTSTQTCTSGADHGLVFEAVGTYKDMVLSLTWLPQKLQTLESGSVTAKLEKDNLLKGHGVYIEPNDGKVYTSNFAGTRK